jgi:hypothetical protein
MSQLLTMPTVSKKMKRIQDRSALSGLSIWAISNESGIVGKVISYCSIRCCVELVDLVDQSVQTFEQNGLYINELVNGELFLGVTLGHNWQQSLISKGFKVENMF